jgi:hypothetical protein
VLDSPCTFHKGGTHTVRECQQFKRAFRTPEDPKRPEVMGTGHRRVATTTATTTNADAGTMITVTTGDVITNSRKTMRQARPASPHRRQATPTVRSNWLRGRST